jgi:predicted alpha/beta-fold hydrolase
LSTLSNRKLNSRTPSIFIRVITSSFSFDDAWDYYNKTSTLNILDKVSVPQLIIQSKDDPFMQGQGNPVGTQEWPLRLQYTDYGGHCGHILHSKQDGGYETSWMPTEMARFLSHIEVTLANDLDIISPDLKAEPVLQIEV